MRQKALLEILSEDPGSIESALQTTERLRKELEEGEQKAGKILHL